MSAHVRVIHYHRDAVLGQVVRGPDPRQHQQLRGVERARRQHDLAFGGVEFPLPGPLDVDAGDAPLIDPQPQRAGAGRRGEVRPAAGGPEVTVGRGPALPALLGDLVQPRAELLSAVEVVAALDAGADHRLDDALAQLIRRARVFDEHGPGGAVVFARPPGVVLRALEQRQYLVVRPAGGAVLGPRIVVIAVSADVDHRVLAAAPAEHLAPRMVDRPPVQVRLGLGVELPVVLCLELLRERRRNLHVQMPTRAARLDEQHPDGGIG